MSSTKGTQPPKNSGRSTAANPGADLSARELAEAERKAAGRISLKGYRGFLIGGLVLYLVSLVLPFKSGVLGFQALLFLDDSLTIAESVLAVATFLSLGLGNSLLLLTRRTWISWAAWFFTGVSLFVSLFALWMRGTQSVDSGTGIGVYLSVFGVFLLTYALSCVILRRDPEQARLAELRAANTDEDLIARTQREAMITQQRDHDPADNPLLQDDRRSLAAERHRNRGRSRQ